MSIDQLVKLCYVSYAIIRDYFSIVLFDIFDIDHLRVC